MVLRATTWMSAEDFEALPGKGRLLELVRGRLVERMLPGFRLKVAEIFV